MFSHRPTPKIWQTIITTLDYAPELDDTTFLLKILNTWVIENRNQDVIDLEASSPVANFYSDGRFYSCYQGIKEINCFTQLWTLQAMLMTVLLVPQCHEFYEETNLISYACYYLLDPNPVVKEIKGPKGEFNLIILLNG